MEPQKTDATTDTNTTTPPDTTVVTNETTAPTATTEASSEVEVLTATTTDAPKATEAVAAAAAVPAAIASNSRRQMVIQYGVAFLIVLAMGIGLWYALEQQGRVQTGVFDSIEALISPEPAVATVNGERITMAMVEKNKQQLTTAAVNQGLDPNTPEVAAEIQAQAVDLLINTELLRQAANAAGVTVSAEESQTRYDEIVTQLGGEEALTARMTELGITPESLQTDIVGELTIQKYLETAVDTSSITITEEAIVAFYEQVGGGSNPEFPLLEDVREQIEFELRNQQEQQLISDHIATLKETAVIEML